MDFIIGKYPVYFINLKFIEEDGLMFYLTKILFYEKPEFINFHYNTNDGERSILISEDAFSIIQPILDKACISYTNKYHCAYILNTNEFMDDTGIVQKISTLFGQHKIPILYITTYNNNFVLFSSEYYNQSVELLKSLSNNTEVFLN